VTWCLPAKIGRSARRDSHRGQERGEAMGWRRQKGARTRCSATGERSGRVGVWEGDGGCAGSERGRRARAEVLLVGSGWAMGDGR
jgi:hypothetical protein